MPDTAIVLIATGELYWQYINPLLESAHKYFIPHTSIVWTDHPMPNAIVASDVIRLEPQGFPFTTLLRYHTFLMERERLEKFKYIFYVDVDAYFSDYVAPEEILADGITATLHVGYYTQTNSDVFPLEKNPESAAFVNQGRNYFAGGFVGGISKAFLDMGETIRKNIDADLKNGIIALWHDESHLNRYLYDNQPAKILGPEFCCPDFFLDRLKPKIRLIQKPARTECLRCGKPVYDQNLCETHFKNCSHFDCGRPTLRNGICGHHQGYVQFRTKGPDSHLKWCTWIVAERLEKIGMGEIIRDNG